MSKPNHVIKKDADCNYQRAISQARKEAEKHPNAAFVINGVDNETACPKKPRKTQE